MLPRRFAVGARVSLDGVGLERDARGGFDAVRLHAVSGNRIVVDAVAPRVRRMLRAAAQVNSRLQHLRLVRFVDAPEFSRAFVAPSRVQIEKAIAENRVSSADQE